MTDNRVSLGHLWQEINTGLRAMVVSVHLNEMHRECAWLLYETGGKELILSERIPSAFQYVGRPRPAVKYRSPTRDHATYSLGGLTISCPIRARDRLPVSLEIVTAWERFVGVAS